MNQPSRILFMTPVMRPCDGISDYVLRIACASAKKGHSTSIISINDIPGGGPESEQILDGDNTIGLKRFTSDISWGERRSAIRRLIEAFQPDYISLQLNLHKLGKNGIIWAAAIEVPKITAGFPVHVMLHELWFNPLVPYGCAESLKRLARFWPLWLLMRLLRPQWVHASAPAYCRAARSVFPRVDPLPIFSNIRPSPTAMIPASIEARLLPKADTLLAVIFGIIHPTIEFHESIAWLERAAARHNKQLQVIAIGDNGYGDSGWHRLCAAMTNQNSTAILGRLPEETISALLARADIGISHTPVALSTKSGTTAAFLEHGLPVLFYETRPESPSEAGWPIAYAPLFWFTSDPIPESLSRPSGTYQGLTDEVVQTFLENIASARS